MTGTLAIVFLFLGVCATTVIAASIIEYCFKKHQIRKQRQQLRLERIEEESQYMNEFENLLNQ